MDEARHIRQAGDEAIAQTVPPQRMTSEYTQSSREVRLVLLNGIKLMASLLGTVMVAFAIRFLIPRYAGPAAFGQLNFADAYTAGFFVFTSFGIDSFIRKEVSTRIEYANEFWAGFWLLRLAAAAVAIGCICYGLWAMDKGSLEWRLSLLFALGQIAFVHNFTVAALLQAAGEVNELSLVNVVSKILWGAGIWVSLVAGWPLELIAVAFLLSEGGKAFVLSFTVRKKLNLQWNVNLSATWLAVAASFPYFLNYMSHRTYERLNIILLSGMTNDLEVGWFGAAMNVAAMSGLFLPILQAVVVPFAARTGKRNLDAMNEVMRKIGRFVIVLCTPISLLIMLHANSLCAYAFGDKFGPSAISLRLLAPQITLSYLATFGAMHLIQLDRIWTMIKVSLFALAINPLLNVPLIMLGSHLGPGWAGGMSAVATICTELANAVLTFWILGRAAVDRRLGVILSLVALTCVIVSVVHWLTQGFGLWGLPAEGVLYLALVVLLGAMPLSDLQAMWASLKHGRAKKQST